MVLLGGAPCSAVADSVDATTKQLSCVLKEATRASLVGHASSVIGITGSQAGVCTCPHQCCYSGKKLKKGKSEVRVIMQHVCSIVCSTSTTSTAANAHSMPVLFTVHSQRLNAYSEKYILAGAFCTIV